MCERKRERERERERERKRERKYIPMSGLGLKNRDFYFHNNILYSEYLLCS